MEVEANLDTNEKEIEVQQNEDFQAQPVEEERTAEPETAVEALDTPAEELAEPEKPKRKPGSAVEKEKNRILKQEIAEMRAEVETLRRAVNPAAPQSNRPQLANFDTVEEYLDAELSHRESLKRQENMAKAWSEREAEARKKHEDYDDAFEDFISSKPSRDLVEAVVESPVGPDVVRYLGSNPDELNRIRMLSPKRQAVEIGKIEAKLDQPVKPAPKTTKASPPITPVKPVSVVTVKSDRGYEIY